MKPNYREAWRQAGITNDFIFGNVMQVGNNCRDLLRAILPDLHIQAVHINTQKQIHDKERQRGVRLDIYAEDDCGRLYNVEMQVSDQHNLGQRIRYYQSKIDTDSLGIGKQYDQIRPSYIIFLLPFDPYDRDWRRYTFHLRCDRDPQLTLATRSTVVLLNSTGHYGKVTTELQGFFNLMNGQNDGGDHFNRQLIHDIDRIKTDPAKEREFMDLAMKLYDERQADRAEGKIEGRTEGQQELITTIARKWKTRGFNNNEIQANLHDLFGDQVPAKILNQIVDSLK